MEVTTQQGSGSCTPVSSFLFSADKHSSHMPACCCRPVRPPARPIAAATDSCRLTEPSTRRLRREPRAAVVVRPGFTRLYVGNLNFRTTAADLGKHFQQFGAVQVCHKGGGGTQPPVSKALCLCPSSLSLAFLRNSSHMNCFCRHALRMLQVAACVCVGNLTLASQTQR